VRGRFHPQPRRSGTTLARFDDALRPIIELRTMHTHPEAGSSVPPVTPSLLSRRIKELKTAWENLDSDTLKIQPRDQLEALREIREGIRQIDRDGLADVTALRPRDLHYAGYYREIQFARLAKATGLYDNWDKSFRHNDPRDVEINRSISHADNMAHKFHAMRGVTDKSILPVSVVAPEHRGDAPGWSLSALMRELRQENQTR
jgi:hypothetical protein